MCQTIHEYIVNISLCACVCVLACCVYVLYFCVCGPWAGLLAGATYHDN